MFIADFFSNTCNVLIPSYWTANSCLCAEERKHGLQVLLNFVVEVKGLGRMREANKEKETTENGKRQREKKEREGRNRK
jgi:hypothetical protein